VMCMFVPSTTNTMSRVIAFRFWSTRTNTMYTMAPKGSITDLAGTEEWKVMQYTGKNDCNGEPIYEGDILVRQRERTSYRFHIVVGFSQGCFGGVTMPGSNHYLAANQWDRCDSDGGGYDLVNIYENPELTK